MIATLAQPFQLAATRLPESQTKFRLRLSATAAKPNPRPIALKTCKAKPSARGRVTTHSHCIRNLPELHANYSHSYRSSRSYLHDFESPRHSANEAARGVRLGRDVCVWPALGRPYPGRMGRPTAQSIQKRPCRPSRVANYRQMSPVSSATTTFAPRPR